ncbi:MAG: Crp/Fnr family transcriptional regulator [Limnohabitans sp.]|nr:Crp/Fnr family transcriptional regulator [Limnohabitans sp.]
MESLIAQITQYEKFTDTELKIITSKFKHHKYKSKEYILKEGQTSTELHFIVVGLARVFYHNDGKEINTYLACDDGFISSYSSFINQSRAVESIQCLEDTETFSIDFNAMQELYASIPNWQKMGRILAESTVLCLADRLLKLHSIPAKQKYIDFLNTSPKKIVQRTPLIQIASFLGITPESLSRIRKEIS